ncbi:DUF2207 domain-containing protein [Rhodococcus sp. D2-41]|uniref:DUF2207 domain-containing protein n=1 Tax=Speluncibacter jeojiensis TaxID=2710754 RepID=UPI00240F4819|nr:DUF2207 domain-containing protein [Rhodococcus sp. D2-41]MDG3012018.1 DUF2207 domain-containing protein [Rhodococcus sp. D2-41]
MKRLIASIVLVVLTGIGLLWPLAEGTFGAGSVQPSTDPSVVTDYDATYQVAPDGHLEATETLVVDLPAGRHGIFRYFPAADPTDPHARILPTVTGITMDGASVPVSYSWKQGRSLRVARIGDPDRTVPAGVHTYVISYTIDNVLARPSGAQGDFSARAGQNATPPTASFFWNVVGFWEMPIRSAHVAVDLPGATGLVQCAASASGEHPCAIEGAGTDHVTVTATDLPPRNPVTLRADLHVPLPPHETVPWTVRFDKVLGRSVPVVVLVAVLSAITLTAGYLWERRSREAPPGLPVMYTPPEGLGPAQTVYIVKESVGGHALVATLLHMAERGLVDLTATDAKSWTITGKATTDRWATADPVTRRVGETLGVTTAGSAFAADGGKAAGQTLLKAKQYVESTARSWSRTEGLVVSSTEEWVGRALVVGAAVLAVVGFVGLLGVTMWGLPFAAFVIGGVGLLATGVGTRRTAAGRQVWSRAGGFERLLSTPSSEDRFDYAARKDLFIAYVPYAVAFGVADKWAAKYRTATGQEAPVPLWFPAAYYGGAAGLYSGGGFDAFDSALSSSIGAYQAAQRSSSSGSGGSSWSGGGGWGGGGGGGGGSW